MPTNAWPPRCGVRNSCALGCRPNSGGNTTSEVASRWWGRTRANAILGSPHNPKFLWVDDAEIVGDRITEVRPVPRNFFTQETERRVSELGACCVAFVVRDVSV